MSRKVKCAVTGKSYTFNKDYFQKKVEEYGSEENLKKYFVTKKVKTLIGKGYSVSEIRNLENVTGDVLPENDPLLKEIIDYHKIKTGITQKKNKAKFMITKSDPEVVAFIKITLQHKQT